MPNSMQARLTTWQQNKIMESFAWDAEKERIVYVGDLQSGGSGDFTVLNFTGNGVAGKIKLGYELLPSGRTMVYAQYGLDTIGDIGDADGFIVQPGGLGSNVGPIFPIYEDWKPVARKLFKVVSPDGNPFNLMGAIALQCSDTEAPLATGTRLIISGDGTTIQLYIDYKGGSITSGSFHGTITTII